MILDGELQMLRHVGWPFAAFLDAGEDFLGDALFTQGRGEDIGRCDGVLDSEVHADSSDGRHGMRGIANAEQAGEMPPREVIDLHGEQLDLVPAIEFLHALAKERNHAENVLMEGFQTFFLEHFERALSDEETTLPIVAAIDHDDAAPGLEIAETGMRIVGVARHTHPEDIEGRAQIGDRQSALFADA